MPGLFGAVAVQNPSMIDPANATAVLTAMGDALSHTRQECEFWSDPNCGIYVGRVAPGGFNAFPWAGESSDGGCTAHSFVAGCLTKKPPQTGADESGIAAEFLRNGPEFLAQLHGQFALLTSKESPSEVLIAVDRCAHVPLYFTQLDGVLYFAPEVKALLCLQSLSRDLDLATVGTFLGAGQALSGRSLLRDVRCIRGGQALSISDGKVSPIEYWRFRPGFELDGTPEKGLEEELGELITKVVGKHLDDVDDTVIFLSGGIDSRAILAGALEATGGRGKDIRTVTWAADRKSENSDAGVAEALARKYGLRHRFMARKTTDYERDFEVSNFLIDGKTDMAALNPHEHQLMLDLRDQGFRRAFRGDQVFGQGGVRKVIPMTNEQALADTTLRRLRNLDRASTYIRPDYYNTLAGLCDEVLDSALEEVSDCTPKQARDVLYCMHRTQMFYNSSSYLKQVVLDVRNVLLDDEILDFLARVPDSQRAYKRVLQDAMRRRHPELWSMPFATDHNVEDWEWQFGHDTEVRRYAVKQIEDTSSGIWEYFDRNALRTILESMAGHVTKRNPIYQRPVKQFVKKALYRVFPRATAGLVIGGEARFHPKHRILARVLTLKHWYDSVTTTA